MTLEDERVNNDLRERLAALCHEQWSGWMRYLFEHCSLIPESFVIRWKRQMNTPYTELSEEEKESDRKEADRFLTLLPVQPAASTEAQAERDRIRSRVKELQKDVQGGYALAFQHVLMAIDDVTADKGDLDNPNPIRRESE